MQKTYTFKRKIFILIVFGLLIFLGVINRNSHIKSYKWKSNSSNRISDFIEFRDIGYNINGKSIVHDDKDYGTIIFCLQKYLIVTNSEGKLCLYSNKGKVNN